MEPLKTYKKIPTQRSIAKKLGITEQYVSMIISGKRKSEKYFKLIRDLIEQSLKAA